MKRFNPGSFSVLETEDSESDAGMGSSSEESKDSTTEPEENKKEVEDTPAEQTSTPIEGEETQTERVEETKEAPFSARNDVIKMDLEWLSIVKAAHSLMPIGKGRFDFDEYVHPLQEGHHKLILQKEEIYKELKEKDLNLEVSKLTK